MVNFLCVDAINVIFTPDNDISISIEIISSVIERMHFAAINCRFTSFILRSRQNLPISLLRSAK